jgi:hypothetical protein
MWSVKSGQVLVDRLENPAVAAHVTPLRLRPAAGMRRALSYKRPGFWRIARRDGAG